ncbi:MAG: hypothetical protein H6707_00220 [Deltaproteobacteria bacterium]|nr:hypothetical protein [Deltaproteobacteria bacterium]
MARVYETLAVISRLCWPVGAAQRLWCAWVSQFSEWPWCVDGGFFEAVMPVFDEYSWVIDGTQRA